jgi:tetratricopeptide (TPR) repeat protein
MESSDRVSKLADTADNNRYELALRVGVEALRQEKWQHAMMCFEAAKEGLPEDPRVYLGMGDAHLGQGDTSQAQLYYEQAARLNPKEPIFLDRVADARARQGDTQEAARALILSGDVLWERKETEAAAKRWLRAAALRPDSPSAHERLALLYRYEGDKSATIRHYLALVDTLLDEGRRVAALHICTVALRLAPDDPAAQKATEATWRRVALANDRAADTGQHVRSSDLSHAAEELAQWQLTTAFRQGTLATPNPTRLERNILLGQGLLNEGSGRAGQAIECYEQVLAAGMHSPALFYVLGLLYRLVGRPADARAALTLAARDPFYRQAVALISS